MRLTKIYTKIGDKGNTMLAGGESVPKDHIRIEAYGTIDELNAHLGHLRDSLNDESKFDDLVSALHKIQNEMHDVGGELSTPQNILDISKQQVVNQESIDRLESEIDKHNDTLQPLTNFVLPGGHRLNSLAQICRTVCRRSERRIWSLSKTETVREEPIIYVNRLSDWLFVIGRVISARLDAPEVLWKQVGKK